MSGSVHKTHISWNPHPHGSDVGVNLQKNPFCPRNGMKCLELYITHVWQHKPIKKGEGVDGPIHDNHLWKKSMECETHGFYSPPLQFTEKNVCWKCHGLARTPQIFDVCNHNHMGKALGHITKNECLMDIACNVQNCMKLCFPIPHFTTKRWRC